MGHAFDDRAGCALLLATLEELDFSQLCGKVYFVFSTQEEVGLRGARVASQQIGADVALAVDTTPASDTPEPVNDGTVRLGGGPAIKAMDHSLIANVAVRRHLVALAKQLGLPYQIEIFPGIGTDGGDAQRKGRRAHRGDLHPFPLRPLPPRGDRLGRSGPVQAAAGGFFAEHGRKHVFPRVKPGGRKGKKTPPGVFFLWLWVKNKKDTIRSCLFHLARLRRFERPTNGVGGRYSIH